jgi:hypothetical protein
MLLATATPVQIHPVEAWDLLDALARGSDTVLGSVGSPWRNARSAIGLLMGLQDAPTDFDRQWEWIRNPLPPASEGRDFQILRQSLRLTDVDAYAKGKDVEKLRLADKTRIERAFPRFLEQLRKSSRSGMVRSPCRLHQGNILSVAHSSRTHAKETAVIHNKRLVFFDRNRLTLGDKVRKTRGPIRRPC